MISATSRTADNPRKQIGSAVWLLVLLARCTPATWTGDAPTYVAGGKLISDAELEAELDVKPRTLEVWRRKLKAAGFLDWTFKPGVGRVYVIAAVNPVLGVISEPNTVARSPAENAGTLAATPAASRWLQ